MPSKSVFLLRVKEAKMKTGDRSQTKTETERRWVKVRFLPRTTTHMHKQKTN